MKKLILWCGLAALFASCSSNLTLNDYVIVVPQAATETENYAATELQRYLKEISGTELKIVSDSDTPVEKEILIGYTNRTDYPDAAKFGQDGFVIRTVGKKVAIHGGDRKGTLYGVYTLLEEYLGCRKYTAKVEIVPKSAKIQIPATINNEQIPVITSRYTNPLEADSVFVDWNKLSQDTRGRRPEWGLWVHTFKRLCPPDKYFAKHPEYYSLVKGQRATTQLCLANPEVLEVVCEHLKAEMDKKPEAKFWSVSSDDNFQYCQCPECAAIDAEEGSPAGSVVRFVNKVAERFPDKVISTLGYQYTRKAPKTKPAKNVNIMFCSIECNRDLPIDTDPTSADFRKDMEDWAKLTDNILVWDYAVSFKVLQSPFPNFGVLQPNMQFFVKNNVVAMFEQCSGGTGGEFCELRGYLVTKLLWNPNVDMDATINDFCNGYYGAAGPYVRQYIDLVQKNMTESGQPLKIFRYTIDYAETWLSPAKMAEYHAIFDKAEAAVAGDPAVLERVKIARQPINFAELELSRMYPYGEDGFLAEKDGKWSVKPEWVAKLDEFAAMCNAQGVRMVTENHSTPDQYKAKMMEMSDVQQEGNLAYRKPVVSSFPVNADRNPQGQGLELLTDGLRGTLLHVTQWLGFYEPTVDFDVDLGEVKSVKHVNSNHLQILWESAFLPEKIEVLTSVDGKNFTSAASQTHTVTKDPFFGTKMYNFDFAPRDARYVRLKVSSMDKCPLWHYYAGDDALMFIDEIVVR